MFGAIGRYFRALGYLMTGRIDKARRSLSSNPAVIEATFDKIIADKITRINQYKDALGGMIAQEEKKKATLKQLTEDIDRLRKLRDGAAAMARKVVERYGGDADKVRNDPDYIKTQAAFKDFNSTLAEKETRCQELEADIRQLEQSIAGHKVQLTSAMREIDKLKSEKHETIAEMMTAREEKEIADMLSGISQDRTNEELQELREVREQSKATARVSRELAGVNAKRSEEEFLEYATKSASDSEFDALIGLTKKDSEQAQTAPAEKSRIPEN
ncbi:MAG: hypothetical protein U0795_16545 [Pirellulales bacterium]